MDNVPSVAQLNVADHTSSDPYLFAGIDPDPEYRNDHDERLLLEMPHLLQ